MPVASAGGNSRSSTSFAAMSLMRTPAVHQRGHVAAHPESERMVGHLGQQRNRMSRIREPRRQRTQRQLRLALLADCERDDLLDPCVPARRRRQVRLARCLQLGRLEARHRRRFPALPRSSRPARDRTAERTACRCRPSVRPGPAANSRSPPGIRDRCRRRPRATGSRRYRSCPVQTAAASHRRTRGAVPARARAGAVSARSRAWLARSRGATGNS